MFKKEAKNIYRLEKLLLYKEESKNTLWRHLCVILVLTIRLGFDN